MKRISKKDEGRSVLFSAYDDREYLGQIVEVSHGVVRLVYDVPGLPTRVNAYLGHEAWDRLTETV